MEQGGPWPTVDELLQRRTPVNEGLRIRPQPFFVAKTTQTGGDGAASHIGRKIFLNILGSGEIDAPGEGWGTGSEGSVPPQIERAIRATAGEKGLDESEFENVRFPLSMAEAHEDVDKMGQPCVVIDCIFNIDVVRTAMASQPLKKFLTEMVNNKSHELKWKAEEKQVAIGWMGEKLKIQGSSEYKFPKIRYKGETIGPIEHRIRRDPRDLIKEVEQPEKAFGKGDYEFGFGFLEGSKSLKKSATSSQIGNGEKGRQELFDFEDKNNKLEMSVVYCSDEADSKAIILIDLGQVEHLKKEARAVEDRTTDFSIKVQDLRQVKIDVEVEKRTMLRGEFTLALYSKDTGFEAKIVDKSMDQVMKESYSGKPVHKVNKSVLTKSYKGTSTLIISIPLARIECLVEICRRRQPHTLGEIRFASSGLMDLD